MAEQNYSGLFQTPEALMQAREAAIQQQAQAYAKQTPMEAARQLESVSGARIGQGVRGLLGVQDTELQKVSEINDLVKMTDMTDEESVKKLAVALGQRGHKQAGEQAYMKYKELVAARAAKEKDEAEIGLKKAQAKKNESDAAKNAAETSAKALEATARKEALKALGVPETQIAGIASNDKAFESYVKEAGTSITEADGKVWLVNERTGAKIKELGKAPDRGTRITNVMPGGGTAKLSDILPTLTAVRTEQGTTKEAITQSTQALKMLELNNPKADAQVDRALATLAGDKQLSQAEVTSVANAGSFPQRVVDNVSKFFSGQAGTLSTNEKKELLQLLNKAATANYNKNKARLKTVLSTSELSKDQVDSILGDDVVEYSPSKKQTPQAGKSGVTKSGIKYTVED